MHDGCEERDESDQGFATTALLWLELLALAIGVLQFAFSPSTVQQPLVAALALALLGVTIVLVRTVPALQRPVARQHWIGIGVLLLCATLLTIATGAAHSTLVTLYLIPLAAIALSFGRWWLVVLLSLVIAALGMLLGALTPEVELRSVDFAVSIISKLLPGAAVALILAALIEQMQSAVQRISDLAASDHLTGLPNLRAFEDVLAAGASQGRALRASLRAGDGRRRQSCDGQREPGA